MAFDIASQSIRHLALEQITGYVPAETAGENRIFAAPKHTEFSPLGLIAVISIGGLLSGLLVLRFAPEAEGHGTDAAIAAFHQKRGYIRPIVPIIKLVASALTIGSGGSGGPRRPDRTDWCGFRFLPRHSFQTSCSRSANPIGRRHGCRDWSNLSRTARWRPLCGRDPVTRCRSGRRRDRSSRCGIDY
jgi:hypothetical protein